MMDVMAQFVNYHSRLYSKQTPDPRKTEKYLNTTHTKCIDQQKEVLQKLITEEETKAIK